MRVWAVEAIAQNAAPVQEALGHLATARELNPNTPWLIALIRRQLMWLGCYEQALSVCEQEVALGGDSAARVSALRESAALKRCRQQDLAEALQLLRQALLLQPGHVGVLADAAALQMEAGLHGEVAETVAQLARVLESGQERALCLFTVGTVREAYLDQPEAAEAAYRAALEADPEHVPAAMALCQLYERTEQWEPFCRTLAHLAEVQPDREQKARLLLRSGTLHLDRTGDLDAAARDLRQAAAASPRDPTPLQRLAYVYEANGNTEALVATLRQLVELTLDTRGQAALFTRIGWLLQGDPERVDEAAAAYQEALRMLPGYLPAVQALGTLHRQRRDYERLLESFRAEAEGPLPTELRAIRFVEIAELLRGQLDRPEEAARAYRRALELQPGMQAAFWGLRRILKSLGHHQALAQLLSDQAETAKDSKTRNALLMELAGLQAKHLGDISGATATLERARAEERTRLASIELIELYEHQQRYGDLVELLLSEANDTEDAAEARGRRLYAAHILEFELEEHERALAVHSEIIAHDPESAEAIRAAGRLQYRLGRWKELIELHRHELNADPHRADVAAILCRMGRIFDQHLRDTSAAIKAYLEALQHDPTSGPALAALERLTRTEQRWNDAVSVLEKYADARTEPAAAADALCRAAELADTRLNKMDEAARLYQLALQRCPDYLNALHGLLRLDYRQGDWRAADRHLEALIDQQEGEGERSHLQFELARLRELRLKMPPPLDLYQGAAQGAPYASRLRGEWVRVQRVLKRDLADTLDRLADQTLEPSLASSYLLQSVFQREFSQASNHESLDRIKRAWEKWPEDLAATWALERRLRREGEWRPVGRSAP